MPKAVIVNPAPEDMGEDRDDSDIDPHSPETELLRRYIVTSPKWKEQFSNVVAEFRSDHLAGTNLRQMVYEALLRDLRGRGPALTLAHELITLSLDQVAWTCLAVEIRGEAK